jgi:Fe2+ transport system protein FeoA
MRRRSLRPLATLAEGERARVREIREVDSGRMARWKEVGLVPGSMVLMRTVRAADDVFEVEVEGQRFAMGGHALEGVMVERARGAGHGRTR